MQADILDRRPDNRQATGLRREHINLIGALPHIAEEAFDGIGGLNMAVHRLQERHKTSTGALRPQPGFAPLRDSACAYLALKAVSWVNASCFVGCSQMPTSSA